MSDKRLMAALAKIELDNDAEALAGARFATRLLRERGLDWVKVAEMITGRTLGDVMEPDGAQERATPSPAPANDRDMSGPSTDRRTRTCRSGAMIPAHVYGTVRIDEEGSWQLGKTLVVTIISADGRTAYGPLKVFDQAVIRTLREAAIPYEPRTVTVTIRQAVEARFHPVVMQASLDGYARAA